MPVKRRRSYLSEELINIGPLYTDDRPEYNRRAAQLYALLRETWEAAIEEVLFHNTIQRHGSEVHTLNLRYVSVTDEDYKKIFFAMKKCSKWMLGHDKAKMVDVNRPPPEELSEDINALKNFEKDTTHRNETVQLRRKKSLEPDTSEIG
jgi:recombinational DNA repair ATPase RecF